ncbi:unnamed protein product, partial [marine sediment metagenome]
SHFPAVVIQPAPGVLSQRSLATYNRGNLSRPESRAARLFSIQQSLQGGEQLRGRRKQDASRLKGAAPPAPKSEAAIEAETVADEGQSLAKGGRVAGNLKQGEDHTAAQEVDQLDFDKRGDANVAPSETPLDARNRLRRQWAAGRANRLTIPTDGEEKLGAFRDATALIEQLQRQQAQSRRSVVNQRQSQGDAATGSHETQSDLEWLGYVDALGRARNVQEMQVLFLLRVIQPGPATKAKKSPAAGKAGG